MTAPPEPRLDPLIHEAARLQLVVMLNECAEADFNFLLRTTGLSRGNLSAHMAKLVAAGYVDERKEFINRMQHTAYRLSKHGKTAFKHYLAAWERLTGDSRKA